MSFLQVDMLQVGNNKKYYSQQPKLSNYLQTDICEL